MEIRNIGICRVMNDGVQRLISEVDRLLSSPEKDIIIAIDGRCAAGKTTLSELLKEKYGCNVFHMDDFFLRPEQRTPERLAIPGENIDHERFLSEVLMPLTEGREVSFRKYDCSRGCLTEYERAVKSRLNIIEGVYSLHPSLADCYDLAVFYDITPEEQRERILHRNTPEKAEKFFSTWIPLEERYFEYCGVREKSDLIL